MVLIAQHRQQMSRTKGAAQARERLQRQRNTRVKGVNLLVTQDDPWVNPLTQFISLCSSG